MNMATRTDTESPALDAAGSHDLIRVHGARENNLKDVSVENPKRRLTGSTGVSGSGKSSLVFDTIARGVAAAEQRHLQRLRAGLHADPSAAEVDVLEKLTTAIIVDHERMGGQCPLHGRHRHRCQRAAAHPLQPTRQAAYHSRCDRPHDACRRYQRSWSNLLLRRGIARARVEGLHDNGLIIFTR
jgi:hypothetical protein